MTLHRYSIGVDLGGTNLRVAAYHQHSTDGGQLTEIVSLPTRVGDGPHTVADDMSAAIVGLLDKYGRNEKLAGVGLGTPGPLELPEGILRNPPNLPGFDRFNLKQAIEQRVGAPVVIESDANLAALAEFVLGSGKSYGVRSLCMLTLGTGVGNGIILDGKIWNGNNGMGGEAGHNTVDPDGEVCPCGSRGCLELYASATGVRRMAEQARALDQDDAEIEAESPMLTARHVADSALAGDSRALKVFDRVGTVLGIGLGALVNTLNLPLYVIGGGMSAAWELFAPRMMEELRMRSYVYRLTAPTEEESRARSPRKTHVVRAELGSDAGILGACLLPFMQS
ncbi:Glucokinase [Acidisarcina polymorpha]|uniref:Glucokinase n=1 Tax=Acidisarcina polymorpha TaxID=2211140 RepID=A0A2Z5G2F2_9BACT|nr:ROK family protein [Acidisarcina polymorpha]AXC12867.1 Glucokinase [Acidisarcina polymorpha]